MKSMREARPRPEVVVHLDDFPTIILTIEEHQRVDAVGQSAGKDPIKLAGYASNQTQSTSPSPHRRWRWALRTKSPLAFSHLSSDSNSSWQLVGVGVGVAVSGTGVQVGVGVLAAREVILMV
jgi:hypothetical protein